MQKAKSKLFGTSLRAKFCCDYSTTGLLVVYIGRKIKSQAIDIENVHIYDNLNQNKCFCQWWCFNLVLEKVFYSVKVDNSEPLIFYLQILLFLPLKIVIAIKISFTVSNFLFLKSHLLKPNSCISITKLSSSFGSIGKLYLASLMYFAIYPKSL